MLDSKSTKPPVSNWTTTWIKSNRQHPRKRERSINRTNRTIGWTKKYAMFSIWLHSKKPNWRKDRSMSKSQVLGVDVYVSVLIEDVNRPKQWRVPFRWASKYENSIRRSRNRRRNFFEKSKCWKQNYAPRKMNWLVRRWLRKNSKWRWESPSADVDRKSTMVCLVLARHDAERWYWHRRSERYPERRHRRTQQSSRKTGLTPWHLWRWTDLQFWISV